MMEQFELKGKTITECYAHRDIQGDEYLILQFSDGTSVKVSYEFDCGGTAELQINKE